MIKILKSGLRVQDSQYYQLLDWKDKYGSEFLYFASHNNFSSYSINQLTAEEYKLLSEHVKFIKDNS